MAKERSGRKLRQRTSQQILRTVLAIIATLTFVASGNARQSSDAPRGLSSWHFRADWTAGYSGWMSFPLAQDVGYDPSLYTEAEGKHTALVHTFTSHGEKSVWFGVVRPLKFRAGPGSSCEIAYELDVRGTMTRMSMILGAADGHRYAVTLPSTNGKHRVHILGTQLGLKASTAIDVIVLKGLLLRPETASRSEWTLEEFVLNATRSPLVPLSRPKLQASSDGSLVSTELVTGGHNLNVAWTGGKAARIALFAPDGKVAATHQENAGVSQAEIPLPSLAAPGLWRAQVEQGNARTEFEFLVLGKLAAHPRLLLTAKRLEQLRGEKYAAVRKQIHAHAESLASKIAFNAAAGNNIELMPSGPGIEPAFPNQLRPYLELMESYSGAVAYNALDYQLNGNQAALAAARRALLAMAGWKTWMPPRFRSHGLQTYYEVGVAAQLVALGYDLIADQLSEQDKSAVEQAFWTQVIAPAVQEYYVADRDPIGASNWMANSVGGALTAAIAVVGDTPDWERREGPAIGELQASFELLLKGLFPGDGSEAEPFGYENFAMQGVSWGMSSLAALQITPRGTNRMMEGFWWPYYATVAPGMQLDTGDFNGHLTKLPGFAWGAEFGGIPELRALYDSATQLDLSQGASAGENGHFLEEMSGPLDLVCCSMSAKQFDPPPPSRVFPERGSAVFRSGWGRNATVISLRAGPWFNHEHHDEGSFQVAALGEKLIDEAGYASYYLDPRYPDYFTQAPGHNTIVVDGNAFSQGAINGRYWAAFPHPYFASQLLGSDFNYLAADLTTAYDGTLQSYRREFFFIKPGILVVRDQVRAGEPHIYSWLLHVPAGATLNSTTTDASIQVKNSAATLTALGLNAKWRTETTPLPISLFDKLDKQRIQPREELVLDSPKAAATEFVVAMRFGAASGADDKMERWSNASGEGVRTLGNQAASMIFRTGQGPLRISELSTDGSALLVRSGSSEPDWMSVGARVVQKSSQVLARSTMKVDLAVEHRNTMLELTVHNDLAGSLQLFSAAPPKHVAVDGQEIRIEYQDNMLTLPLPSPGEHHVSIQ